MKRYVITYTGRKVGSLGFNHELVQREVEAESRSDAALKAYDTHEHIPGGVGGVIVTEKS
jgi:hypothetical protein